MVTVLWRMDPLTCGVCANAGWLVPELNCSTLVGVGMPILKLPVEPASWCQKPEAPTKSGPEMQVAKPPLTEVPKVAAVLHVFSY